MRFACEVAFKYAGESEKVFEVSVDAKDEMEAISFARQKVARENCLGPYDPEYPNKAVGKFQATVKNDSVHSLRDESLLYGSYHELCSRGAEAGWNRDTMLFVACDFIDDRIGSDEFREFIKGKTQEEWDVSMDDPGSDLGDFDDDPVLSSE